MYIKKPLLLVTALLTLMSANAQQVSEQEALVKAQQFLSFNTANQANASRGRAPRKAPELSLANNRSEFYVFNDRANGGYVVVSGEERMPDVLAYSYDGSFDTNNMPCNMQAWLEEYAEQVKYLMAHPEAKMTRRAATERENIAPLLTCWFSQGSPTYSSPYNEKCPVINGEHSVTGCVATAMAQIMYYWKWPKQTTDVIPGYITKTYGINMPDIPITTIDWDNMLNEYDYEGNYTAEQRDAISTLMLLCGTSVEMDYAPSGSGASPSSRVLWKYFGYDDLAENVDRNDFNTNDWEQLMYDELNNGRPVFYRADGGGGHAFVLDGYKDGYFHVNWGWGGADAYVLMSGTEGWREYISGHAAVIGIQPEYPNSTCRYGIVDNGKLTLYYDNKKDSRSGTVLPHLEDLSDDDEITECIIDPSFANVKYRSLSYFFSRWKNLKAIHGIENLNTSKARSMESMFFNCQNLESLDLSSFNTENVTSMNCMFLDCRNLTNLNLSGFNTENVTDMYAIFSSCKSLKSLDLRGFNTDNVVTMGGMFDGCSGLTSLDLSGFNTDNVTNMERMFNDCSGLTSLDISGLKTGKVRRMVSMFNGCSGLTSLDLSGFNTENVTNMNAMFEDCSGLTSLDMSGFNTENVTNMAVMFSNCSSLTNLDVRSFTTDKVTSMAEMFSNCSSLTNLDLSSFNTDYVTSMRYMFSYCSKLSTIYVSERWNMSKVDNTEKMFYRCIDLVGGAGTTYDENHIDGKYAHVDGGPDYPGYFTIKEIPDAIATITSDLKIVRIYDLQGKRHDSVRKGLNIIVLSDGTIKKVVAK